MNKQTITKALFVGAFLVLVVGVLQFMGCGPVVLPGIPDGGEKVEVETVPDGWEEFVTEQGFTFAYPPDWHVVEHQKFGVLISDQEIDTRHEIYDVPITITIREEGIEQVEGALSENHPSNENVKFGSLKGRRFEYKTELGPRILYALILERNKTLKVGIVKDALLEEEILGLLESIRVEE